MTVSISNMAQVWFSNSNVYNAISMTVSTLGVGGHPSSSLLKYTVDGNVVFRIDTAGKVTCPVIETYNTSSIFVRTIPLTVSTLPNANTIGTGTRAFVTDANTTAFMGRAYANGNNAVPVFSNGKYWLIG